jgi:hypothetical protein
VTSDPALLERLAEQLDTTSDMIVALQSEHFTSLSRQLEEGFNQGAFRLIRNRHVKELWRKYCGPGDAYRVPTLLSAIGTYLVDDLGVSEEELKLIWSGAHQAKFAAAFDADCDQLVRFCCVVLPALPVTSPSCRSPSKKSTSHFLHQMARSWRTYAPPKHRFLWQNSRQVLKRRKLSYR